MVVKVLNKCEDCNKQSVCKYAEIYTCNTNLDKQIKGETTILTVECSEFSSKPKLRNCFPGDRQDG